MKKFTVSTAPETYVSGERVNLKMLRSRPTAQSAVVPVDFTYAGLIQKIELAMAYDSQNNQFVGRIKNETGQAICDVSVDALLEGEH